MEKKHVPHEMTVVGCQIDRFDIVFRADNYCERSHEERRCLFKELTHSRMRPSTFYSTKTKQNIQGFVGEMTDLGYLIE